MKKNSYKENFFQKIKGSLFVSCQAYEGEPFFSPDSMARMARCAMQGGAKGIRANSIPQIQAIMKAVPLPVIGLIKTVYEDSPIYITPTMQEVDQLAQCGCDIIALDATLRPRPGGVELEEFFGEIRSRYPTKIFMADCSTAKEALNAQRLGFDCVGTTLRGYTEYTKGAALPGIDMIQEISRQVTVPIFAEGGIWTPQQLQSCYDAGAHTAVVGTAITRPIHITGRFVEYIQSHNQKSSRPGHLEPTNPWEG